MNGQKEMSLPSLTPGGECWQVIVGYGVRRVLLRRFTAAGLARVSKPYRFGEWRRDEIEIHPRNLFLTRDAALAKYRLQPRRRLADPIPGLDAPRAAA